MEKCKIQFICEAVKWYDRVNGNTHHSVRITRTKDGAKLACMFEYGYGEQYRYTALMKMVELNWLPESYNETTAYAFERENDYPIYWIVSTGTKKECIANGVIS
jgi:hypothetical protein